MDFELFLNQHWNIFIQHACEYHKMDVAFLDKYQYELDWSAISKNENLDWNLSLISKFDKRYRWHELLENPGIEWTLDLLSRFPHRKPYEGLFRNNNNPISLEYIKNYPGEFYISSLNKHLNTEIREIYKNRIVLYPTADNQKLTVSQLTNLEEALKEYKYYGSQKVLYSDYIKFHLESTKSLEEIFSTRFDYSQRYYYLNPVQSDIEGLTPEFKVKGQNPLRQNWINLESTLLQKVELEQGSLQEGPDRLYECPRFYGEATFPSLLISENILEVLNQFKLPNHRIHEVNLNHKKIKTSTRFFILELPSESLFDSLDYPKMKFNFRTVSGFSLLRQKSGAAKKLQEPLKSKEDLKRVKKELTIKLACDNKTRIELWPDNYKIKDDLDLYTFQYTNQIIINQFVKDVLEFYFPNTFEFTSAQLLNLKIEQSAYDLKAIKYSHIEVQLNPLTIKIGEEEQFYRDKMNRLKSAKIEIPEALFGDDDFSKIEKKLSVLFPDVFKSFLKMGLKDEYYENLHPDQFFIIEDFASRNPQTYRAVIVAENGCGDYIGLILEKESDYKLQRIFFEFMHETGEVKKYAAIDLST
ncbi:MAG: hypothetical protein IPH24_08140 [Crocinitomicaceae bacterium]|nr:hypothetical protein [Crocinitomicaceae bacterium]